MLYSFWGVQLSFFLAIIMISMKNLLINKEGLKILFFLLTNHVCGYNNIFPCFQVAS